MIEGATREPSPDDLKVAELGLKQPLSTIELRSPQLLGFNYGLTHPKHILSMDKGMGKTIVYILTLLSGEPEHVIISCPTNAMSAQRREILRHFPHYADKWVIVRGTKDQRYKLWRTPGAKIFITTPATLQADTGGRAMRKDGPSSTSIVPPWVLSSHLDGLSLDEFQKYIRNRQSKTLSQLLELTPGRLILSSGSPVSKGPQDLFAALHLVDRKFWSSYWRYVHQFCEVDDGAFGKQIIGPKNVDSWRRAVAPYVFHRKKDPRDYPPKSRNFLEIDLEPWQRKLHDQLRNDLWAILKDGSILTARNPLDATYKARLGLICPKVLDNSYGYGAGLEGIVDDAADSELTHFAISTPFKAPIPFIEQYLRERGYRVWILAGGRGISPDDQDRIIAEHQAQGGVIIQTIKYATSYEYLGFEHNYFLGYEYDPEDNKQAEDRWSRVSSTLPCFHWYVKHPGTYDEDLINMLVEKSQNTFHLMDKGKYWDQTLLLDLLQRGQN